MVAGGVSGKPVDAAAAAGDKAPVLLGTAAEDEAPVPLVPTHTPGRSTIGDVPVKVREIDCTLRVLLPGR